MGERDSSALPHLQHLAVAKTCGGGVHRQLSGSEVTEIRRVRRLSPAPSAPPPSGQLILHSTSYACPTTTSGPPPSPPAAFALVSPPLSRAAVGVKHLREGREHVTQFPKKNVLAELKEAQCHMSFQGKTPET